MLRGIRLTGLPMGTSSRDPSFPLIPPNTCNFSEETPLFGEFTPLRGNRG